MRHPSLSIARRLAAGIAFGAVFAACEPTPREAVESATAKRDAAALAALAVRFHHSGDVVARDAALAGLSGLENGGPHLEPLYREGDSAMRAALLPHLKNHPQPALREALLADLLNALDTRQDARPHIAALQAIDPRVLDAALDSARAKFASAMAANDLDAAQLALATVATLAPAAGSTIDIEAMRAALAQKNSARQFSVHVRDTIAAAENGQVYRALALLDEAALAAPVPARAEILRLRQTLARIKILDEKHAKASQEAETLRQQMETLKTAGDMKQAAMVKDKYDIMRAEIVFAVRRSKDARKALPSVVERLRKLLDSP